MTMYERGLPVQYTENGTTVTARGGWPVGDDHPRPGDTIGAGPVVANGEPRYLERFSWGDVDVYEGQPLDVVALGTDEPVQPCMYCSDEMHVAERGVIDSDVELLTKTGETVGYSCIACIDGAEVLDDA